MKTKKIKIQSPWGRDLSADVTVGRMSLPFDGQHPFWIAVGICGLERQMVRIGFTDWHPVKERFESNPDVKTLHAWEKNPECTGA